MRTAAKLSNPSFSFLIALSLFFLSGLSALLNQFLPLRSEEDLIKQKIQKRTYSELKNAEQDITFLKNFIESDNKISFSNFQRTFSHPSFIYKNGTLKYWSSYTFKPDYNKIKGNYSHKMLFMDNGKFLIRKKVINYYSDVYEFYVFIRLSYRYPLQNQYIQSKPVKKIFPVKDVYIHKLKSPDSYKIKTRNNNYLYSVRFNLSNKKKSKTIPVIGFLMGLAGVVFLIYATYQFCNKNLKSQYGADIAFIILLIIIFLIRGLMLLFYFPQSFIDLSLFDPKFFASSSITPSLGDLLLNVLALFTVAIFIFNNYYQSNLLRLLLNASKKIKSLVIFIIPSLILLILYSIYNTLRLIYFNSQISLDVTQELEFGYLKLVCFVIYFFTAIIYFLVSHTLLRIYNQLFEDFHNYQIFIISISGLIIYHLLFFQISSIYPAVSLIGLIYIFIVSWKNLPGQLIQFKYTTYIYLFFTAICISAMAAWSVYQFHRVSVKQEKNNYASNLVNKNDELGEYLLAETRNLIQKDPFIKNWFLNPLSNKELIKEKIKRLYISDYFDKYNLNIYQFNHQGKPFYSHNSNTYQELLQKYDKKKNSTDYESIYLVKKQKSNTKRKYLSFIPIKRHKIPVGFILLKFVQRKVIPNSVYPELLVDQKFNTSVQNNQFSYGIYKNGQLISSSGTFNYLGNFKDINNETLEKGLTKNGYLHHLFNWAGKKIIVSNPVYPFKNIYANFSFLFLIMSLVILMVILANTFYYNKKRLNNSFITKMHILINLFYFVPLLVVSITIFSVTNKNFRENLKQSFIQKAESIGNSISVKFNNLSSNKKILEDLTDHLTQMGKYTESDINLYNKKGRLLVSTQPKIFEKDLISPLINPRAYKQIIENRSYSTLLQESVGDFRYNTVYIGVKSFDTGKLLGVVGLPFYESKKEFEDEILGVMSSILSIFTTTFLVFLALTYFGTRYLTIPLRMVKEGIRKISLKGENKPLKYQSNDEIGLLVNEYNSMLIKLENSKRALAQSEKENAWREMARQVAHEIKNPLTPMRLTLQQLQKNLNSKNEWDAKDEHIKKSVDTLLTQVENLNEIATSFHSFTQMPLPKQEKVNLSKVLYEVLNLYEHEEIETQIPDDIYIMGDEKLLNRIFSNLIINGLQSIPEDRKKQLKIYVNEEDNHNILVTFSDNGIGIPENIRDKVFVPNFSTKYAGSGIGLAVAKKGIENFGGEIWFETMENNGTSFYIRLPRIPDNQMI